MRHSTFGRLVIFILLVIITSGLVFAAPTEPAIIRGNYDSIKSYLFEFIQDEMKRNKVTGLSIALVDGDQMVLVGNFGYADLEQKKPVTAETLFRVGSISKLFTATAVMQLAEQGKIDIDQPLQTYIPEFTIKTRFPDAGPITIRSMMTHHSGLPGDRYKDFYSPNPPYFTSLVDDIKDEYTAYPPGYIWSYSNLAMSLLGVVVERVSGEKFNDYVEEHILKPMAMNHSSFQLRDDMKPLFALGYAGGKLTDETNLRDVPAGGLYSSVQDLSQFVKMVFSNGRSNNQVILESSTLTAMLTPQNENIPLDLNFKIGLNWMLSDPELSYAGKVAQHGGDTNLYHSMLETLPEHQLGVVVLTNSATGAGIVGKIARKALKMALEVKTGIKEPAATKPPAVKKGFSEDDRGFLAGSYATPEGLAIIGKSGRGLILIAFGQNFKMIPREDGWFSIKPIVFGFIPWHVKELDNMFFTVKTIQKDKVVIVRSPNGETIMGEAVEPSPIPEAWMKRLGEYQFMDTQSSVPVDAVQLKIEQGLLLAEFMDKKGKPQANLVLMPVNDGEAIVRGLGRSMHETIRAVRINEEEVLLYSGLQLKKGK